MARASVVAVQSAVFTPTAGSAIPITGNASAEIEELVVWPPRQPVTDGAALPAAADLLVETALAFTVVSHDVTAMLTQLAAGQTGQLVVTGTLVGSVGSTKMVWTNTKVQVRPWRRATLPGQRGGRQTFAREFRPMAGGTSTMVPAA